MKLTAICLGRAEKVAGKSYRSGIGKQPVAAPVMIDAEGLVGDAVCNRKHHGGPDQAVLLEGSLTLGWWAARLGRPLPPGSFGENLVVGGLDNRDVCVGDRFVIGEVVLQAASARIPCNTLAIRMGDPGFGRLYTQAARPGIYCRVLRGGVLKPQDAVEHVAHEGDRLPVAALLAVKEMPAETRARYLAAPLGARACALIGRR